eukprot:PITA_28885
MKLVDTDTNNGLFTWNNKRGGEAQVASKLDKFIISKDLMLIDKEIIARVLPFGGLDHWPIQLEIKDKKFVEISIQELNEALITEGFDKVKSDQVDKHHQEWENLCKQEEIFWRQKSRVQWLEEGECDTRFFHGSAMANRAHNRISSIKDKEGELLTSHKDIETVFVQHFQSITQENNSDREQFIRDVTRHIPKLLSREDNFNPNRLVTEEEVREVLKDI